jgi:ankyrin repeat protein
MKLRHKIQNLFSDPNEALLAAVLAGEIPAVHDALARGANANCRESVEGQTPLHLCVRPHAEGQRLPNGLIFRKLIPLHTRSSMVQILMESGAEVSSPDNDGVTPLHWVAALGYVDLAMTLIPAGADPCARDSSNYTPLHQAVETGRVGMVRLLLEHGADVNVRSNFDQSPLGLIENYNRPNVPAEIDEEIRALLLEKGAIP